LEQKLDFNQRLTKLAAAHRHEKEAIMSSPATPKRILVVDDEPFVCDAVKMMLEFDGHQVDTASSARAALEAFAPDKYDLVITDYAMPQMKGDELALRLRERAPGQPIVLITAYAEMLKASQSPLTAIDGVVSKPFLLEDLRATIAKATTRKRS
jgi:CheY-like chemotaxis protein